ncbi:MAG: chromosome segregation SMC family protein [Ignavibacteriales bacterium]
MYLKEIKAHGFKSFADRITIDLNKDITGIVGPNGSGKSNIVDAVRWVLGEQSVKSLRGDGAMSDVIFSGSKSRNPLNVASVTLVFDNSDHYLPLDYNEISIKRILYKDGTNEYLLNNEKCRLKDISDLLMDSGIAKESFNIISQGKIEEILSNKPSDRRVVFEEAAGVLKYKKRKEDALRKLDRTHDNMNRVTDIINELETQVGPLKEQKEKALAYLSAKEELESIEIALITEDITNINYKYKEKKSKVDEINNELLTLTTSNTGYEAKIEEYKLNINKVSNELNIKQQSLIDVTTKVEKINSQKKIILERQKYNVEDSKLHNNLIELKETELKLQNDFNSIKLEISNKNEELVKVNKNSELENTNLNKAKDIKNKLVDELNIKYRHKDILKNRIENLKESIENNSALPSAVKNVLNNPKLRGVHDVIGNLIEVEKEYSTAISTSLGFASTNIVVDSELSAKEAINYLKDNNLGRATFFPLNIIKPKAIEPEIIDMSKRIEGYIGVASDLIKFDSKYNNIILNQLGNVIVCRNIDSANTISKKINYRYRVVTIDGELLHVGGSVTGGNAVKQRSVIVDKYELETAIKDYDKTIEEIKLLEDKINENDYLFKSIEDKLYLINREKITINDFIQNKNNMLSYLSDRINDVTLEIKGTNNLLNNTISDEEESILNEYYQAMKEKDVINNEINNLNKIKNDLSDSLEEFELSLRRENNLYNNKNKELKDLEIEVNRMDVKLDNLLNSLNELYNITYEKAVSSYKLDIPSNEARSKVNSLKNIIKEIGVVNLGAPEEYDRISTRYEFLINQREDLLKAENTLLEIIEEMDNVMKKEFMQTFNIIKDNFTTVFQELFKGGTASLELTDPNNILETGVEIIASPPGKKLTSISLLSGGEKTFTAISLLFAILKSRPVPFCILDEVEAALDEANVNSFGEYLTKLKNKTQFILVTHKKKTLEFVDVLYGITMQESGVSKLVSVKLEELK